MLVFLASVVKHLVTKMFVSDNLKSWVADWSLTELLQVLASKWTGLRGLWQMMRALLLGNLLS